MPIYMDLHIIPGVKATDVAEAHRLDVKVQEEHACTCMTYWVDEKRGNVFCLIEAPNKKAVEDMHSMAHGLIPNKIIEVHDGLVESFLGRITDPDDAVVTENGLKVFSDASFRILLVVKTTDPVLLQHQLGKEKANDLLQRHHDVVRKSLHSYEGREAEYEGGGFVAAFASASKAVSCALNIHKMIAAGALDAAGTVIGINAGEPVAKTDKLFGDTILFAERICAVAKDSRVAVASSVKELLSNDHFQNSGNHFFSLPPHEEALLDTLYTKLEENWQDSEFNVENYCQAMAMSQSQLYRKTITLSGLSPNALLKEFRLEKAKELMKKRLYTISQVTFESGFTSPSYFTKCFKSKYGLLPMTYLDLLQEA